MDDKLIPTIVDGEAWLCIKIMKTKDYLAIPREERGLIHDSVDEIIWNSEDVLARLNSTEGTDGG